MVYHRRQDVALASSDSMIFLVKTIQAAALTPTHWRNAQRKLDRRLHPPDIMTIATADWRFSIVNDVQVHTQNTQVLALSIGIKSILWEHTLAKRRKRKVK